ncbi:MULTISPECIES: FKBP-type peptidyl-prolyl cis-trans isomerase [unclassified Pseudoxanthomonas]|uniref:FKBP-type peptidyl-prolyl cis-trans isomerase n=1 Tax=unclassified Pseudoxanthomonas TaxID=2645906 RepID=UPI0008F39595|nr:MULTISPECIES: FKBP-type peptidyl-prolyl cis-trans isomerase [unclassified Pseudoxanthomonas]PPJ42564.1 FKBP-type peptidyl-prolyl cis-trans isomerase [Pseudoxanthomonas sp. KAs_5_3]SFV26876.1 FKBP-type peptidyl-prolyl cis-trans isomerase FkpA [Pseudoxanthomonas sp. YR558]
MRSLLLAVSLTLVAACAPSGPPPGGSVAELQRLDSQAGTGTVATSGSDVTVHYTGWLYDENAPDKHGMKFDSSVDRGEPFTFLLGAGQVIRGWDEGVAGMKVGGKRTLLIPSDLGYGTSGAGGVIPPGASLVFDVELLDVKPHD